MWTMSGKLSQAEALSLLSLGLACSGIIANTFQGDGEPLIASIAFSGLAFAFSYALIRWLGAAFMRAGLKGRDLCKTRPDEMSVCTSQREISAPQQFPLRRSCRNMLNCASDQRPWVPSAP